jgi:hypothetical protein
VIEGGLDYLVGRWQKIAEQVEGREERWLWEEWVNDLDVREILQDVFDKVPEAQVALPLIEEATRISAGRKFRHFLHSNGRKEYPVPTR